MVHRRRMRRAGRKRRGGRFGRRRKVGLAGLRSRALKRFPRKRGGQLGILASILGPPIIKAIVGAVKKKKRR